MWARVSVREQCEGEDEHVRATVSKRERAQMYYSSAVHTEASPRGAGRATAASFAKYQKHSPQASQVSQDVWPPADKIAVLGIERFLTQ